MMKKWCHILLAVFTIIALPPGSYAIYTVATGNFHEVSKGKLYRSAQLGPEDLAERIQEFGIRSILNLRGKNSGKNWYEEETKFCESHNIRHYDIPLSSGKEVTPMQMSEIIAILKTAPQPLLIHCQAGADRTGFGSALYRLAIEGKPLDEADDELSLWYGHVPFITRQVAAMDRSLVRCAEALRTPAQ